MQGCGDEIMKSYFPLWGIFFGHSNLNEPMRSSLYTCYLSWSLYSLLRTHRPVRSGYLLYIGDYTTHRNKVYHSHHRDPYKPTSIMDVTRVLITAQVFKRAW